MSCVDSLHAIRTRQYRSVHPNQCTHHSKSLRSRKSLGTHRAAKVVFRLIMLDMVSYSVTALERDDGMTDLTPPQFRYKDVRAMGATESMVCFAVLGKYRRVYLGHSKNTRGTANLNHHTLRGEVFGTVWAFKPVFDVVVLRSRVNMCTEHKS